MRLSSPAGTWSGEGEFTEQDITNATALKLLSNTQLARPSGRYVVKRPESLGGSMNSEPETADYCTTSPGPFGWRVPRYHFYVKCFQLRTLTHRPTELKYFSSS
jgi:hypothetical protein